MRSIILTLATLVSVGWLSAIQSPAGAGGSDLAPLYTAGTWLNGSASQASLSGKVVIVDVFTFDCINCKHVVPNLRRLNAEQNPRTFAIVGVHAPETPYEANLENVKTNLVAQGISWPVRIDNDFTVWHDYGIEYWPTQLIFDRHGRLRKTVIGEGQDDLVNATVQSLLNER